jgi:Oxidoreductase molybdopterin binding domain
MSSFFKNLVKKNSSLSVEEQIKKRTFISFFFFVLIIGGAVFAWISLIHSPFDGGLRGGIHAPLRKVLTANEKIFSNTFSSNALAKEYPKSAAAPHARVNGNVGMGKDFDPDTWKLYVIRKNGDTLALSMDDIKKLPKTEVVHNFKCIEGWNQITWWGGVRFSDFVKYYHLEDEAGLRYVGMKTPDEEYYVGIDMPSALQPQTILCYELNGKPLPMDQGFPLRLIIPVKYGIKNIKRIGTMFFDNDKPADYWAERGYDYYSGL